MTKIYLVCSEYKMRESGSYVPGLPDEIKVFTNRRLANAYCEYWNLNAETWDHEKLGYWRYFVIERRISCIDYTKEVIKNK